MPILPLVQTSLSDDQVVELVNSVDRYMCIIIKSLLADTDCGILVKEILNWPKHPRQSKQHVTVQRLSAIFSLPSPPVGVRLLMPIWQEIEAIWWQISDAYTPAAAAHVARKWAKHPHVDDLRSEAILSITGAAQNFDTTRGVKFSYYLTLCMRRAIQHWLAKQSRHVAVSIDNTLHQVKISEHGEVMTNPAYDAVSEATMVPLDTPEGNPAYYLEEKADKEQLDIRRQIINVVLSTLSQRKKSICVHILDGVSRKDTATAVGVSPTHVQNTWREFKQLCRDQFAKRPLVVA